MCVRESESETERERDLITSEEEVQLSFSSHLRVFSLSLLH